MKQVAAKPRLTVYYDAQCPRCQRDRRNYEKLTSEPVNWCDINTEKAELKQQGIAFDKALTELHVKTAQGQILVELDAYIALMQKSAWLKPLAWLIGLPIIKPLLARLYKYSVKRRLVKQGRWLE